MKIILLVLFALLLSGCAIRQNVKPTEQFAEKQICVVENPKVKNGFIEAYRKVLVQKGYEVRMLPPSASLIECPITSTYTANWRWDLAMYMSYAEIKVYKQAKPSGEAIYDATHGGGNMNKFISADVKITELVNQLFPGGAGTR
ncbi:Sbal_3080 family lipoprotein [Roseateles oligotrophus]|uniref:Sbal_3080 family lipoprotein n=1 Tax=Roseateles oligotrophus TaxID=1769250 RepID=A0ABT2YDH6_9BURK|nr:Sbal_3080 family lipoprotein [Roseateles oligotrophus]MCV2368087.1 Sbal_3080 family lipoprotein [Roseateles oligotrophus]